MSRVEACGAIPFSRSRFELGAAGVQERRVTSLGVCGRRRCSDCEARRRRYRAARAEGPWGLMVTLTLDHGRTNIRRAFTRMPLLVGRFLRAVQRLCGSEQPLIWRQHAAAAEAVRAWDEEYAGRERPLPRVPYAWALEPHESGFPHAHVALGLAWLDARWIRKTWRRITGMKRASPDVVMLDDQSGTNTYLTKYITKAVWSPDLAVIMSGRRMFWSSVPLRWRPPAGWQAHGDLTPQDASDRLSGLTVGSGHNYWEMDRLEPGEYREDVRRWSEGSIGSLTTGVDPPRPPESWERPSWEWYEQCFRLQAQSTGLWTMRWYHKSAVRAEQSRRVALLRWVEAAASLTRRMVWSSSGRIRPCWPRRQSPGVPSAVAVLAVLLTCPGPPPQGFSQLESTGSGAAS